MRYDETFHVRLTKSQIEILDRLSERSGDSRADLVRRVIEIMGSDDHVFVPLTVEERLFIEGICNVAGVQPADAIKIVLLSYHTLMSSPLWKIVRPVEQILEEMKEDEREGLGEGD